MGDIIRIIVIVGVVFYNQGITGLIDFFKNVLFATWEILKMINMILIEFYDQSILTYLFSHGIVFYIVGTLLTIFCVRRGKTGKYIGKIFYKIIMYPVSNVLNFLGGIGLFKI